LGHLTSIMASRYIEEGGKALVGNKYGGKDFWD
jgi:hypothetical protein